MPSRGFVLRFTGSPNATRTITADQIAHELKQRGYNVETSDDQLVAIKSESQDRSAETLVEVEPEQSASEVLSKLEALELIARSGSNDSSYDEDDEETIRQRLEALGYL